MKTQDGRTISVAYGGPHQSYFLQNDGKGMNLNGGNASDLLYDNPDLILHSENRRSANFPNLETTDDEIYLRETIKPRLSEKEERALSITVQKYTSDQDDIRLPISTVVLPWNYFNVDFLSSQHDFSEVEQLCEKFADKKVDLRPYMIEEPFTCSTTDKLPKVLEMFRHFHLCALPVINPSNGLPVAVLTR